MKNKLNDYSTCRP